MTVSLKIASRDESLKDFSIFITFPRCGTNEREKEKSGERKCADFENHFHVVLLTQSHSVCFQTPIASDIV